jgi:hypothetical protein
MSGYKRATIKISEADYRRLHEADMKARFRVVPQHQTNRNHEDAETLRSTLLGFEQRQREFQQYIAGLSNDIGQVEIQTAQAMLNQQDRYQQELSMRLASFQEDTSAAMDVVSQDLSDQIEANQRRHLDELTNLTRRLDTLSGSVEHKAGIARNWLDSAIVLRKYIETHYDHNRFLPATFESLDFKMQQAMGNLQDGMPEAALIGAQEVYMECSQARLELERLASEWQVIYLDASELLDELLGILTKGKIVPALDTQGNELPIKVNLDHWSDHHYSSLTRQVRNLRSRLRIEAESITTEELTELTRDIVPRLKEEFDDLVYEARLAVIYSQIRINIADITIQALERQGFMVSEHGFVENNMRKPYLISLQNIEGSQVMIRVNPILSAEAANDLEIESHDNDIRTESELRSRSWEILRSLTQYGLRVGPLSTDRGAQVDGFRKNPRREQIQTRSFLYQSSRHD